MVWAVAILAFGAGVIEGLIRGAGVASVAAGAIAGAICGVLAAVVLAAGYAVRWALPAAWRRGPWPLAIAIAAGLWVAAESMVARELAARFRDPGLVALVAAAGGVVLAWLCFAVGVPIAVRIATALAGRGPGRWARVVGLAVVIGGLAALAVHAAGAGVRPRSALAAGAIDLAQAITDVDGDGDGLILGPRDCAPLSPAIDGRGCAQR